MAAFPPSSSRTNNVSGACLFFFTLFSFTAFPRTLSRRSTSGHILDTLDANLMIDRFDSMSKDPMHPMCRKNQTRSFSASTSNPYLAHLFFVEKDTPNTCQSTARAIKSRSLTPPYHVVAHITVSIPQLQCAVVVDPWLKCCSLPRS